MKTIGTALPKKIKSHLVSLFSDPANYPRKLRLMTLTHSGAVYRILEFGPEGHENEMYGMYDDCYFLWDNELKDGLSYGEGCANVIHHSADIPWGEITLVKRKEERAKKAAEAKKAEEERIKAEEKAKRQAELKIIRQQNALKMQAARKAKLEAAKAAKVEEKPIEKPPVDSNTISKKSRRAAPPAEKPAKKRVEAPKPAPTKARKAVKKEQPKVEAKKEKKLKMTPEEAKALRRQKYLEWKASQNK